MDRRPFVAMAGMAALPSRSAAWIPAGIASSPIRAAGPLFIHCEAPVKQFERRETMAPPNEPTPFIKAERAIGRRPVASIGNQLE